jgi:hypothetical protein
VQRSLGVYLLDALEPAERDAVAEHVRRCPACRRELDRIAPLPGLLAGLDPRDLAAHAPSGRGRRRRLRDTVACVALLVVLGAGAQLGGDLMRPPAVAVSAADPATEVRMAAEIAPVPSGARLLLRLSGVAPGERCHLVVRDADGRTELAGRWRATYAGAATVDLTTSVPAADVSELSVVAADGRRLVRVPVP